MEESQANWNLIHSTLGAGFTVYSLGQALDANVLQLSRASAQTIQRYQAEAAEKRQAALLEMSPEQLRPIARHDAAAEAARIQADQQKREQEAAALRDSYRGYKVMPEEWSYKGKNYLLNRQTIKAASGEMFKRLIEVFGEVQVLSRFRGEN